MSKKYKLPDDIKAFVEEIKDPFFTGFTMPEDIPEEPECPAGVSQNEWAEDNGFHDKRLEYLRGLMSRLLYDADKHNKVLAQKWHIKAYKVAELAREASRQLKILQGNDDAASREFISTNLIRVAGLAEKHRNWNAAERCWTSAGNFMTQPRAQRLDIKHEMAMKDDKELDEHIQKLLAATGFKALPQHADVPDAEVVEDESVEAKLDPALVKHLKSIPESPRIDGDRITPIMPEDDDKS